MARSQSLYMLGSIHYWDTTWKKKTHFWEDYFVEDLHQVMDFQIWPKFVAKLESKMLHSSDKELQKSRDKMFTLPSDKKYYLISFWLKKTGGWN